MYPRIRVFGKLSYHSPYLYPGILDQNLLGAFGLLEDPIVLVFTWTEIEPKGIHLWLVGLDFPENRLEFKYLDWDLIELHKFKPKPLQVW